MFSMLLKLSVLYVFVALKLSLYGDLIGGNEGEPVFENNVEEVDKEDDMDCDLSFRTRFNSLLIKEPPEMFILSLSSLDNKLGEVSISYSNCLTLLKASKSFGVKSASKATFKNLEL